MCQFQKCKKFILFLSIFTGLLLLSAPPVIATVEMTSDGGGGGSCGGCPVTNPTGPNPPQITYPPNGHAFRIPARLPMALPIMADDPDGDNVTINVTSVLPGWVTVDNTSNNRDPATLLLKGTTLVSHIGKRSDPPTFTFTVTATDGVNTSAPLTANVYVTRFQEKLPPGGDTADTQTVDFADMDGDGDLDILTATPGIHHAGLDPSSVTVSPTEYIRLYQNNGNGTFTDISDVLGANIPGGSGCFLAGTPVLIPDGTTRPIEKFKVGDKVLAFDAEGKTFKEDTVKQFFEHDADLYLIVNGHLKVTPNHPVYSDGKWVQIGSLKVGDSLLDSEGKPLTIASIQEIQEKVKVYNLEINPYHTYIAGGVVVHNLKKIPELSGEPSGSPTSEPQLQTSSSKGEPLVMPRILPADEPPGGPGISPEQRWRGMSARFVWLGSGILPDILIVHRGTDHALQGVNQGEYVILQNDGTGRFDSAAYPPIRNTLHGASNIAFFYSHPDDKNNRSQWAFLLANSGSSTISANSRIFDKDRVERTTYFPPPGAGNDPECISEAGGVTAGDINNDGDQDLFLGGFAFYDQSGNFYQTSSCYHNGTLITHPAKDRKRNSRIFANAGAVSGEVGDFSTTSFADLSWPSTVPTDPAGYNWFNLFRYERKADFVDVDLDGSLDLVLADPTPKAPAAYGDAIFVNSGSGNFTHLPGRLNWEIYRDADVEVGDLDLIQSGGGQFYREIIYVPWKGEIRALKTVDSGSWYEDNTKWDFPQNPLGDINNALKLGDLDNDGDLDLYLAKDAADRIYFNMTCTPASPCLAARDAKFISQEVPTTMVGGQTYSVSLTFQNKGTSDWSQLGNFKLGSQNPQDTMRWGLNRVLFGAGTVTTGQYKTFTFNVTAPTAPGTHNFQWQMLQEGVEWFGERSANVSVLVGEPPSVPIADPQSVTLNEDDPPLNIILTGSDAGSDYPLTFSIVSPPSKGTLSAITPLTDTSAQVTYDSNLNENGSDSFTFRVTDTDGEISPPATVSITINPVNDPPTVNAGPDQTFNVTNQNNNPVPVNLSGSAVDPEGSPIAFYRWMEGAVQLGSGPSITYSFSVGSHVATLEASDGTLIGRDSALIKIEGYPRLSTESGDPADPDINVTLFEIMPRDDAFWVKFIGTDDNLGALPGPADDDKVTLSVVGSLPSWLQSFTAPAPDNPVEFTFRARTGRPNTSDIGTHTLTVRATDNSSQTFSVDRTITIRVRRFEDVSNNLTGDSNRTTGADATDIDGDGDKDIVIAHLPSSEGTTWPGVRILINNHPDRPGLGLFTDDTDGRLRNLAGSNTTYYSHSVRFGRQGTTGPFNLLFLSNWRRTQGAAPYEWWEQALAYRLANNGSGVFSPDRTAGGVFEFITRSKMVRGDGALIDASFGADIETARVNGGWLTGFFANSLTGEYMSPPPKQWNYAADSESFRWNDAKDSSGNNFLFNHIDPAPADSNNPCNGGGLTCTPKTHDIELADVDGDNDLDVFTGSTWTIATATGSTPSPARLWLNSGGSFYQYNISFTAINNSKQKAAFTDLDGDGKQDLITADTSNGLKIFRNTRRDGFVEVSFASAITNPAGITNSDCKEVVVGDITGDGKPDIIMVGNGSWKEKILRNTSTSGSISFVDESGSLPDITDNSEGGLLVDIDNDGDLDLYIYNNGADKLYENKTIP